MSQRTAARELLSGNQAIARGAWEAGVTVATGYPGTPSTEILEAASLFGPEMYCEWSPNEKVALEVAAGASLSGARCIVTMKHVGLNVAADPLMTLAYTGTVGGLVICVADDPGMHSSQNEQDTRHYARFAKVPILEPSDSQEAKDFVALGLEISEKFHTPVILRSTTRVSHSSGLVMTGERGARGDVPGFQKNPERFVPIPLWGRPMRVRLEERLGDLSREVESSSANRIEWRDRALGIVAPGISYQYVREVLPEASVLKLGWSFPFPDGLFRTFAEGVKEVLVVEELDPILEEHIRSLGIPCEGRRYVPGIGELSPTRVAEAMARRSGGPAPEPAAIPPEAADLPARPPVLCPTCPHRGLYAALGKFDVVVTGDIGCYSLGVFPPLSRLDTILCMGAGVSMAHGMQKAGDPRKVVGIVGDSTFFHSGITGLLDVAYNRGASIIIVSDNRITAMTGHQEHPGTGHTIRGEETIQASIEDFGRACGIRNVATVDPYKLKETTETLRKAVESSEPWLIVSRGACPLHTRVPVGPVRRVDLEACKKCKRCLKLGCPAIEWVNDSIRVNELLCGGCSLCAQVCPEDAFQVATGECHES
jgi:indolepyruvate ferredoxin oxidoreductase, alpha subunit